MAGLRIKEKQENEKRRQVFFDEKKKMDEKYNQLQAERSRLRQSMEALEDVARSSTDSHIRTLSKSLDKRLTYVLESQQGNFKHFCKQSIQKN